MSVGLDCSQGRSLLVLRAINCQAAALVLSRTRRGAETMLALVAAHMVGQRFLLARGRQ